MQATHNPPQSLTVAQSPPSFLRSIPLTFISGHLVLSSNTTLHLTVNTYVVSSGSHHFVVLNQSHSRAASPGPLVPRLAPANKIDDISQIDQLWSLEIATGLLTFVGVRASLSGTCRCWFYIMTR